MSEILKPSVIKSLLKSVYNVKNAFFVNSDTINVIASFSDFKEKTTRYLTQNFAKSQSGDFKPIGIASRSAEIQLTLPSFCGSKICTVVKTQNSKEAKNENENRFEIYSGFENIFDEDLSYLHGTIYTKGELGGISWNKNATKLVYIAEKKVPKPKSFTDYLIENDIKNEVKNTNYPSENIAENTTKNSSENTAENTTKTQNEIQGEKFLWENDFGENLFGVRWPRLFVLDLTKSSKNAQEVKGLPSEIAAGDPIFSSIDEIIFVGYPIKPFRMGLRYYNTRPSKIYRIDLNTQRLEILSEESDFACHSPRLSPDGKKLVFFSISDEKIHLSSIKIRLFDFETKKCRTLSDIVDFPEKGDFPGFFCHQLPKFVWGIQSDFLIVESFFGSKSLLFKVNLKNSTNSTKNLTNFYKNNENIEKIPFPKEKTDHSATLFEVKHDKILTLLSSPSECPSLWVFDLMNENWSLVVNQKMAIDFDIGWDVLETFSESEEKGKKYRVESIFTYPKKAKNCPLVILLHGGPHSTYPATFSQRIAEFSSLGFATLATNFRGSLGFGQKFLKASLGNENDIDDVMAAIEKAVEIHGDKIKKDKMGLVGGSYGGFLSLALPGKFPGRFSAAVAVNPVADIPTLCAVTDIPDWSYVESGLEMPSDGIIREKMYAKMHRRSPISRVDAVKTPTLFLLGQKDARVPYMQTKGFVDALKMKGVPCKALLYPEGTHSLDNSLEIQSDVKCNIVAWLFKYLKV